MGTKIARRATACLLFLAIALIAASSGTATLSPSSATFTLRPGTGASEAKTADVPGIRPSSADVEIAIDTTGSMGPSIAVAKANAIAIVNGVQAIVPDTQFAVVQFKDFCTMTAPTSGPGCTNPGGSVFPGDYPEYAVEQSMTPNATAVSSAINGLTAAGGGDNPESMNLVFHNSYTGSTIGWRPATRKFVIVISDAEPHGAGSAGVPGCTDTSPDPHALNTATELAGMRSNQRTLFMILQRLPQTTTASLACYQGLAAGAFTGGQGVVGGTDLATQIVDLINTALSTVGNIHLEVVSASPAPASSSWITLPLAIGPVVTPGSFPLGNVGINVPPGTPAGTYHFDLVALADGVDVGHQDLTIIVPQKMLTLSPPTATNPIGTSHTVTAHVFDILGSYVGDTVRFTVSGGPAAVPSSGSGTTDAAGNATFTFSNTPPQAGTNTITATDGDLTATATKDWIGGSPSCDLTPSLTTLWPPNHKLQTVTLPEAPGVSIVITSVTQDEPVNGIGDGNTSPDAFLASQPSNSVQLRAEREGPGDGRVYRLGFTATSTGGQCSGTVTVGVPHDQGRGSIPIDSAPPSYDSLLP